MTWGLCLDDPGTGLRKHRVEDGDDQRDLSEDAPQGVGRAVQESGADDQRGRLMRRTKGGLNRTQHTVTDAKGREQTEIMFARRKAPRRIATGRNRCAKTFLSAVAPATTVVLWP